ncbi:LysR substrate-binding domain-containing protein [Microbacterium sp.]|uniref:LysR substrate-binding domain-containing protein n=1 Tax=Microbacterium sp. TaxID=51671 RepID=UPI0039E289F5
MSARGGAGRAGARGRRPARKTGAPQRDKAPQREKAPPHPGTRPAKTRPRDSAPENSATTPFRLGAIPGATPGTWIDRWHERMPQVELQLIPLATADQRRALVERSVDAALVRLPLDRDGLHAIALYDEVPVVVCASDSHLTAADELTLADLAGELVITPRDDVLAVQVAGAVAPAFEQPATTEEAVATVATGVGVVVVPMSLARLHHRRDTAVRPLADGPVSTVALAWPIEATTPLVETFVGIVRGRTANSSRSA